MANAGAGARPAAELPHVALLIETSRSYGRGVLRGVRRYVAGHGPWSLYLEPRALDSRGPAWLRTWRGDGVLTRTGSRAVGDLVRAAGVPAVELRSSRLNPGVPFVGVDNHTLGQMVVEHLRERGFRRFAVYALDTEDFFRERCDNFVETVRRAGYPCDVHRAPGGRELPARWEKHQDGLARWVRGLAKPVGVMACTDQLGFWLLDVCKRVGVGVPEEVAVVGAEDDETLCSMASPPMSSVRYNLERTGFEAAALLDRLMRGRPAGPLPLLIPPLGVVTRQSSDVVAVEDETLAAALRFIRENACAGAGVEDVLAAVPLSRSTLERGMRREIGRSPHAEIRRVRLTAARRLLVETDLPLAAVAARSGFRSAPQLCEAFRQAFGRTPGEERAASRPDKGA
jgi:LacI family transcriptional regulator